MKLGNILSTAAEPVATKEIKFRVLVSGPGVAQKTAQARAVWAFVDEAARLESVRKARAALEGKPHEESDLDEERTYWFLLAALRDADDPVSQFCPDSDIQKFKSAILLPQIHRLTAEYRKFIADEYPELASPAQQAQLREQAAGE